MPRTHRIRHTPARSSRQRCCTCSVEGPRGAAAGACARACVAPAAVLTGFSSRSGLPSPRPAQAPTGRNLRAFAASRACRNATPAPHAADWRVEAPEGAPVRPYLLLVPCYKYWAPRWRWARRPPQPWRRSAATGHQPARNERDAVRQLHTQGGLLAPSCARLLWCGFSQLALNKEKKKFVQQNHTTGGRRHCTRVRSDPVTPPASPRAPARPEQSGGPPCRTRARAHARRRRGGQRLFQAQAGAAKVRHQRGWGTCVRQASPQAVARGACAPRGHRGRCMRCGADSGAAAEAKRAPSPRFEPGRRGGSPIRATLRRPSPPPGCRCSPHVSARHRRRGRTPPGARGRRRAVGPKIDLPPNLGALLCVARAGRCGGGELPGGAHTRLAVRAARFPSRRSAACAEAPRARAQSQQVTPRRSDSSVVPRRARCSARSAALCCANRNALCAPSSVGGKRRTDALARRCSRGGKRARFSALLPSRGAAYIRASALRVQARVGQR